MEFLDTILGAAIAATFFLAGRRSRPRPEPAKAICGCGHHRSFHKNDGQCKKMPFGDPCKCQSYHGPKTLDDIIAEDS